MRYMNLEKIFFIMLAALFLIGTASAVTSSTINVEMIEDAECDLDVWTYGNPAVTSTWTSYFSSSIVGGTWTDADGRLAVIDENGYMLINTLYPTNCFCIVFASDSNDGYARVYVDDVAVWEGDTWANVGLGQDINAQKIRSLKISGLESTTHTIKIENVDVTSQNHICTTVNNGHVTVYKYGYDCPENEIPEFPTIALPIAAILGLAFIFRKKEE
ncbi:PEF-CTERM sorting domain-containing protein [Methanolobus sp. WCC5]|uniref:PEF-CTERM sorting domain-containing protein n=1 Tax=Methanolobus sp. WCC5 TaxID=3125785 RepID=UPI003254C322